MRDRMTPIRYTRRRRRLCWRSFFERLAARYHAEFLGSNERRLPGITPDKLEATALEYWRHEVLTSLRSKGLAILGPRKVATFRRRITIQESVYESRDGELQLVVELAERNEYPVIGAWTWMERDLMFAGGFLTIRTSNQATMESIVRAMIRFQGRRPPQRITRCWGCGEPWPRERKLKHVRIAGRRLRVCATCGSVM